MYHVTIWRSLPGFTPTRMAEPRLSALSGRACVVLCFCTEPTWADRLILFSPRIIFFCFVLRDDGKYLDTFYREAYALQGRVPQQRLAAAAAGPAGATFKGNVKPWGW